MEAEQNKITDLQKLLLLIFTITLGWLIYQLSAVLMPFFIAALFAYLGDPLVDRLEERKISRTMSVTIVFGILFIIVTLILVVMIPLLSGQVATLISKLPTYISKTESLISPWLNSVGLPTDLFNLETLKEALSKYWSEFGQVAGGVFSYMTHSGAVLIQWVGNMVMIPVLTFYLLRDWDILVARFRELIPRRYAEQALTLSLECDEVLAAFLRGQLMVMLALSIIYTIGLSLIGLQFALLVGVVAGIVSFVPYLGLIIGIVFAGLAAFFQFGEIMPIVWVVVVFSVAQLIEGTVLTPRFVGEQIGLHPVAVIFAVLAGGQLFGFTGVLLALPVAAVVVVLLRHIHQRYMSSELYS